MRSSASKKSRLCRLSWTCLESFQTASLLEIRLETGFLHQIRVMFAHLGHPVLGDALYGTPATAQRAPRQMLHAYQLSLLGIKTQCPDPNDFKTLLNELQKSDKPMLE